MLAMHLVCCLILFLFFTLLVCHIVRCSFSSVSLFSWDQGLKNPVAKSPYGDHFKVVGTKRAVWLPIWRLEIFGSF